MSSSECCKDITNRCQYQQPMRYILLKSCCLQYFKRTWYNLREITRESKFFDSHKKNLSKNQYAQIKLLRRRKLKSQSQDSNKPHESVVYTPSRIPRMRVPAITHNVSVDTTVTEHMHLCTRIRIHCMCMCVRVCVCVRAFLHNIRAYVRLH